MPMIVFRGFFLAKWEGRRVENGVGGGQVGSGRPIPMIVCGRELIRGWEAGNEYGVLAGCWGREARDGIGEGGRRARVIPPINCFFVISGSIIISVSEASHGIPVNHGRGSRRGRSGSYCSTKVLWWQAARDDVGRTRTWSGGRVGRSRADGRGSGAIRVGIGLGSGDELQCLFI